MTMTDNDIALAVIELKAAHPEMGIDRLGPNAYHTAPDPVEEIISEALRNGDQVQDCLDWLKLCPVIKTTNLMTDTYGFKHEVERWKGHWVSHTSLLVAVQMAGIPMRREGWVGLLPLGAKRPVGGLT